MSLVSWKPVRTVCVLLFFATVVAGCATQPDSSAGDLPGFLPGLLHGGIILFSLIGSLFTDYRVYAYPNAGWVYDFGFFLGLLLVFGGGAGANGKKRRTEHTDENSSDAPSEEKTTD